MGADGRGCEIERSGHQVFRLGAEPAQPLLLLPLGHWRAFVAPIVGDRDGRTWLQVRVPVAAAWMAATRCERPSVLVRTEAAPKFMQLSTVFESSGILLRVVRRLPADR